LQIKVLAHTRGQVIMLNKNQNVKENKKEGCLAPPALKRPAIMTATINN
jgi:hypothetical protein